MRSDNYNSKLHHDTVDELTNILTSIISKGSVSEEETKRVKELSAIQAAEYNRIAGCNSVSGVKLTEADIRNVLTKELIINILTDNGRKSTFSFDDFGNIVVGGKSVPQLSLLAQKLNLIATDTRDRSSIVLTPGFIQMIADSDIELTADKIIINGYLKGNGWYITDDGEMYIEELNANVINVNELNELLNGNLTSENVKSITAEKIVVAEDSTLLDQIESIEENIQYLQTDLSNTSVAASTAIEKVNKLSNEVHATRLEFNEEGELVVTINGVSKTFVPKDEQ